LVEGAITRIEALNPRPECRGHPHVRRGAGVGARPIPDDPFAGVPFLLNDFIAEVAGVRFTEGVAFLQDYIPTEDSELAKRYKRAGLLIVDKTNLPALALGATTEWQLVDPTHTWDLTRTPSGSSGGAALLTPTLGQPPVPLGTFAVSQEDPFAMRLRIRIVDPFTYLSNTTRQPAMPVPLYCNADNLPIGSHFVGRFGEEGTLFRLAGQLEAARPWADRRPAMVASAGSHAGA
jgi:Asp-tRNA(Asn)/Glu-tRNA(Gln) amidotransferase A subunit family amidase